MTNYTPANEARHEFLDALEWVFDGFHDQIERLLAAAESVADDVALIRNQNAGYFVAKLLGREDKFVNITYSGAARLILAKFGNGAAA